LNSKKVLLPLAFEFEGDADCSDINLTCVK